MASQSKTKRGYRMQIQDIYLLKLFHNNEKSLSFVTKTLWMKHLSLNSIDIFEALNAYSEVGYVPNNITQSKIRTISQVISL